MNTSKLITIMLPCLLAAAIASAQNRKAKNSYSALQERKAEIAAQMEADKKELARYESEILPEWGIPSDALDPAKTVLEKWKGSSQWRE